MVKLLLKLQCFILCPYRHNQRHWTQSNIKITFSDSSFYIFNDLGSIPLEINGGVGGGVYFLVICSWRCTAGWNRILMTGSITRMGVHIFGMLGVRIF